MVDSTDKIDGQGRGLPTDELQCQGWEDHSTGEVDDQGRESLYGSSKAKEGKLKGQ